MQDTALAGQNASTLGVPKLNFWSVYFGIPLAGCPGCLSDVPVSTWALLPSHDGASHHLAKENPQLFAETGVGSSFLSFGLAEVSCNM